RDSRSAQRDLRGPPRLGRVATPGDGRLAAVPRLRRARPLPQGREGRPGRDRHGDGRLGRSLFSAARYAPSVAGACQATENEPEGDSSVGTALAPAPPPAPKKPMGRLPSSVIAVAAQEGSGMRPEWREPVAAACRKSIDPKLASGRTLQRPE